MIDTETEKEIRSLWENISHKVAWRNGPFLRVRKPTKPAVTGYSKPTFDTVQLMAETPGYYEFEKRSTSIFTNPPITRHEIVCQGVVVEAWEGQDRPAKIQTLDWPV